MELITILSTIILIATISTFILSIGAYILYKIRDRREQKPILSPVVNTQAELVTVNENEEWDELKRRSGKSNLPRMQVENLDIEKEKQERKVIHKIEKSRSEKSQSPRFIKYSSLDNESGSGEFQWK
jgi:uncharacterized ion transporter superfamily protein YfcC